ncbi:MAG TPA: glycosyltransferase family 4 protein [Chthoniobacterales bacterium]
MEIGILHYSMPPLIGGVERVIEAHARMFQEQGDRVRLYHNGRQPRVANALPGIAVPGMSSPAPFDERRDEIVRFFEHEPLDCLIAHNIFTMPFDLAATAALWKLSEQMPVVSWVHDLAAASPFHRIGNSPAEKLLRCHPKHATVVAVSQARANAYKTLTGHGVSAVIPNGVDVLKSCGLSLDLQQRLEARDALDAFPVLLHPARILKRKNFGLGLRLTAALQDAGLNPLYVITGAPEPFTGKQALYRTELDRMISELRLENSVIFLSDDAVLTDADVRALYGVADALFFPSEEEGFGLPVLEAGAQRLPVFCSENQPLVELARLNGVVFPLQVDPATLAAEVATFLSRDPANQVRKTIRDKYHWRAIFQNNILPLLQNVLSKTPEPTL